LFTRAEDPLDADVWLRVVESKFPLLNGVCSDVAKVRFATQRLHGPAQTWWDHFLAMQLVDHMVEWGEFKAAFRGHHILAGIMDRKLNEFLALTKGTVQCCSTLRFLMTYVNTQAIMLTQMKRRGTGSGGASVLSSATVSTQSGPTATMS
jgi:hypothetical protein